MLKLAWKFTLKCSYMFRCNKPSSWSLLSCFAKVIIIKIVKNVVMNQFGRVAAYLSIPYCCVYSAQCRVSLTFLEQSNCAFSWIKMWSMKVYYTNFIPPTCYSHSWPSSGMCITKCRYIEILQKFLSQCTEVKLNFKNNAWLTVCIKVKTHIKSSCE